MSQKRAASGALLFDVSTPVGNDKTRWLKIGVAFGKDDGSITVKLDALPVGGKIHLFPRQTLATERKP